MNTSFEAIYWDFDGTLIPFDSEQFLLESLFLTGSARRSLRTWIARLFVYGDRHSWDPGMLKVLYGWCLRGVPFAALDAVCAEVATHVSEPDRAALRSLAERGPGMKVLSCGTADLSLRTLRIAGLAGCFERIEANWFIARDGAIAGIERRICLPETKVGIVAGDRISWERVVAVGDGLTDLPLLDRAGLPVLVANGGKAERFAGRGYHIVSSLGEAIALIASRA